MTEPDRMALSTQLFRFVATGVLSAIVDFGLFVLGMRLGLEHVPAKAISFVFGTLTAYSINRVWTFNSAHSNKRLAAVVALYGLTFALQVGLVAILFPPIDAVWGRLPAQVISFVIAQGVATTVNFVVQRTVVFRGTPPRNTTA